ncbi:MAG: cache domain-containing protein [Candidatus Omnitrophica bacterium]|nr:cache domain-containing protein [Candidatus Omnitrophota bacterium]
MKKIVAGVVLSLVGLCFFSERVPAQTLEERKAEMVAFVNEGLDFAKKNGKEAFLKEVMREGTPFVRGELYFYAYDFNCVCISHGEKPHLVGKDLSDLTDKKGLKVIQALRDEAAKGSG